MYNCSPWLVSPAVPLLFFTVSLRPQLAGNKTCVCILIRLLKCFNQPKHSSFEENSRKLSLNYLRITVREKKKTDTVIRFSDCVCSRWAVLFLLLFSNSHFSSLYTMYWKVILVSELIQLWAYKVNCWKVPERNELCTLRTFRKWCSFILPTEKSARWSLRSAISVLV